MNTAPVITTETVEQEVKPVNHTLTQVISDDALVTQNNLLESKKISRAKGAIRISRAKGAIRISRAKGAIRI
jgi:hypothetical protein